MAVWRVSNCTRRSVAEREIWTHPDKGEIVREILFTDGAYLVTTEDDNPPEFKREAVPGGDGAEDSVDMNFCGYETQLIGLDGGCNLLITWPDDLSKEERQALADAWDEGMYEAWEEEGWELDDTEVWFWDNLNIELLEPTQPKAAESHANDSAEKQSPPDSPGKYSIETVEKVKWPNFPITEANWNGESWVDEDGEPVNVRSWKLLNTND